MQKSRQEKRNLESNNDNYNAKRYKAKQDKTPLTDFKSPLTIANRYQADLKFCPAPKKQLKEQVGIFFKRKEDEEQKEFKNEKIRDLRTQCSQMNKQTLAVCQEIDQLDNQFEQLFQLYEEKTNFFHNFIIEIKQQKEDEQQKVSTLKQTYEDLFKEHQVLNKQESQIQENITNCQNNITFLKDYIDDQVTQQEKNQNQKNHLDQKIKEQEETIVSEKNEFQKIEEDKRTTQQQNEEIVKKLAEVQAQLWEGQQIIKSLEQNQNDMKLWLKNEAEKSKQVNHKGKK